MNFVASRNFNELEVGVQCHQYKISKTHLGVQDFVVTVGVA